MATTKVTKKRTRKDGKAKGMARKRIPVKKRTIIIVIKK